MVSFRRVSKEPLFRLTDGRLTKITVPDAGQGDEALSTSFTYDPATGLLLTAIDSRGTSTYSYDNVREVTRITHPDGAYKLYHTPPDQPIVDASSGSGKRVQSRRSFTQAAGGKPFLCHCPWRCRSPLPSGEGKSGGGCYRENGRGHRRRGPARRQL